MGLGPAQEENQDNVFKDAQLEITIRDRGKGTKVVEQAINSSKNSMSEPLTSQSGDLEELKPILAENWKNYDLDKVSNETLTL